MRYTVQFTDGSMERVIVDADSAESVEHLAEMISLASSSPDEVDDFWETYIGNPEDYDS